MAFRSVGFDQDPWVVDSGSGSLGVYVCNWEGKTIDISINRQV